MKIQEPRDLLETMLTATGFKIEGAYTDRNAEEK